MQQSFAPRQKLDWLEAPGNSRLAQHRRHSKDLRRRGKAPRMAGVSHRDSWLTLEGELVFQILAVKWLEFNHYTTISYKQKRGMFPNNHEGSINRTKMKQDMTCGTQRIPGNFQQNTSSNA